MHHGAPGIGGRDRGKRNQPERDPERPARDEDRHRGDDFPPVEPVGDHLGHQHVDEYGPEPADQATGEHEQDRVHAHQRAADRHQAEPGKHHALDAEALPQHAARQRDHDARQHVEADQRAELRETDAERVDQKRSVRSDGLELIGHRGPRQEQHGEHAPAVGDVRHQRRSNRGLRRWKFTAERLYHEPDKGRTGRATSLGTHQIGRVDAGIFTYSKARTAPDSLSG